VPARHSDLAGRVVVVTGAGGGIGRAIANEFAAQGSIVAALGRTLAPLEETVADLPRAFALTCDIAVEAQVESTVAEVLEREGRIDVLVNNAASHQPGARVTEMDVEVWERVVRTNLTGTMLFAKHVGRHFASRGGGGAIINIGSLSGHIPRLGNGAYAASKAAVEHLTRTLALELAEHGVRVNAVTPGSTDTPMLRGAIARDRHADADYRVAGEPKLFRAPIPLRRVGRPEEQAAPVVFLASEAAGFMTGQILAVDGGEGII
jgi:NAD(P)-dependent dehydrogenase (short-subunit alcohol dehydrogenase family)